MSDLAQYLETTLLKPDCTTQEVNHLCEEAMQWSMAAVCIPPFFVREARRIIPERGFTKIATVVGFPMGYSAIAAKAEEIKRAVDEGVDEIDAVVNISAIKTGNWTHVLRDTDSIARATGLRGKKLKLILECGLLTQEELEKICKIAHEVGTDYVKTGTGFFQLPAVTVEVVEMLRKIVNPAIKIKAAGGIRTAELAKALISAGADRLGTSAALDILTAKSQ